MTTAARVAARLADLDDVDCFACPKPVDVVHWSSASSSTIAAQSCNEHDPLFESARDDFGRLTLDAVAAVMVKVPAARVVRPV